MDNIHSWLSVEEHHLTEMANLVHYILNIIDGTIIKTSLLKEQRKEKKLRSCCEIRRALGIISLRSKHIMTKTPYNPPSCLCGHAGAYRPSTSSDSLPDHRQLCGEAKGRE